MDFLRYTEGAVAVKIDSADTSSFLTELTRAGIHVQKVHRLGELSVKLEIRRSDLLLLQKLAHRKGAEISVLEKHGVYWKINQIWIRPVMMLGILMILFASVYLPRKVLFIRVEGNSKVSDRLILENLEECGLYFGADRSKIRSETIKNGLLERMEQLKWIGVNTSGCVATVSVRERSDITQHHMQYGVSSIVAVCDGVIDHYTVTKGNTLCRVGQAVKAGEILVSGYTDCGLSIQATRAEGEIYARTKHELTVVSPANSSERGDLTGTIKKYGLIIGKKRINFYKDSGISDISCDKIYLEYYMMLPGGFQLPVAIVEETWYTYDTDIISVSETSAQNAMEYFAESYVKEQMIGGAFLDRNLQFLQERDVYILKGEYMCMEMIGRVHSEEIIGYNG